MSRRGFLTASAFGIGATSLAGLAPSPAEARVGAISTDTVTVNDAALKAFKTHRLVGFGEAHGLKEHHDALQRLILDPRFADVVDDIVIEFANALYQPTIDRFIAGHPVDNVDLRSVWRNTTQSPGGTWDQPVYEQFFRMVRAINWTRRLGKQIRVLAGDPPINWSKITNRRELQVFDLGRDTHAGSVIRRQVLDRGHRALICYGSDHLQHSNGENIASLVKRQTGERIYTIADLTYAAGDPGGLARRLSPYPPPTRSSRPPTRGLGDSTQG